MGLHHWSQTSGNLLTKRHFSQAEVRTTGQQFPMNTHTGVRLTLACDGKQDIKTEVTFEKLPFLNCDYSTSVS